MANIKVKFLRNKAQTIFVRRIALSASHQEFVWAKVQTTKIKGGAEYAKVADRLNEFRPANPRSKISIKYSYNEKGDLTHHAYFWKDKTDFYDLLKSEVSTKEAIESADAEGSSLMYATKCKNTEIYAERMLAFNGV